jgi:nicotinamidase-related amidase
MPRRAMNDAMRNARALLLIDFQNSFFHPDGVLARLTGRVLDGNQIIARAARLVAAARAAAIPIIYTRHAFRPDYADADRVFREYLPEAVTMGGLRTDRWDSAIVDELAPTAADTVVVKNRFDSFFGTDLQDTLIGLGTTTLAVAGALTNICVETTVRSAFQRDLIVHLLTDCCGARTLDDHNRALTAIDRGRFATLVAWRQWMATGQQRAPTTS